MAEKQVDINFNFFKNRELSWLQFNERILGEARDRNLPLFERLKFLSITASNLDEFFMVRVASLREQISAKYEKMDISGMTAAQQLDAITKATQEFVHTQYTTYNRSILPTLEQNALRIVKRHEELEVKECEYIDQYFMEHIYPVLTPMAVDVSRPFPLVANKSLNLGAFLEKKAKEDEVVFATVNVPSVLSRLVELPVREGTIKSFVLLEEVIERNMDKLFSNYNVLCVHPYRVMRNADLLIEEDAEDLLKEIEQKLKKRPWKEAIRLEIEHDVDPKLLKKLKKEFDLKENEIFFIDGPLDLTFLMKLYGVEGFAHLKAAKFVPQMNVDIYERDDFFSLLKEKDILLHHPYESFDPIVDFIKQASKDVNVLAIKQTLYRVSGNSPIVAALAKAAENGKQVTVLVELKARFDEENNIVWAKKLEQAGCHVIYGLVGLKTHSKITLVVRREEDGICRYVHLGTGNYNDSTAKLYTDIGLMTANERMGEDATAIFNMLSGYSEPRVWNKLSIAPLWMKDRFLYLIRREANFAREGKEAGIVAKVNSLCDPDVILELYKASEAGVKIDLIVRGICSLKVGIPGVSENITVRSIVGNFLEHSRIYYFRNNGEAEIYGSSADWMPRNLEKRVEILFPIEEETSKEKVIHILQMQLKDTLKAYELKSDGTYEKVDRRGKESFSSQEFFCEEALLNSEAVRKGNQNERLFQPKRAVEE